MAPHFQVALDLPHAATVAQRIRRHGQAWSDDTTLRLAELLAPYRDADGNPAGAEAIRVVAEAAALARQVVDEVETGGGASDRLGQAIRNLFECLELGEEGASISLRAGESPTSLLRPR